MTPHAAINQAKPSAAEASILTSAALTLASEGFSVFPVDPSSKRPLTAHGHLDATANHETIRAMFARCRRRQRNRRHRRSLCV